MIQFCIMHDDAHLEFCRMIHGMRIKDGKATYVSRYVKTSRLKQEEYFGGAKFMKVNLSCVRHGPYHKHIWLSAILK